MSQPYQTGLGGRYQDEAETALEKIHDAWEDDDSFLTLDGDDIAGLQHFVWDMEYLHERNGRSLELAAESLKTARSRMQMIEAKSVMSFWIGLFTGVWVMFLVLLFTGSLAT